jgi:Recombinase
MVKKLSACPSWLALSDDRRAFVFMPDRADIVREIFELSLSGLGCYTIAKQLNDKMVPPFGPSGRWDQSTIHNMLVSRATIGEHQPKQYRNGCEDPIGDPIPNYYPAVIGEELFQAVQVARQKNSRFGRGRKGKYITNLFPNLITCAYCGGPVKFYSNGSDKSLICVKVFKKLGCCRMAWSCRDFENSFFGLVTRLYAEPTIETSERQALQKLVPHIEGLKGEDVYGARLGIALALQNVISELKLAAAGSAPAAGKAEARIRRDGPGRYFEVKFSGGSAAHIGFAHGGVGVE